MRNRSFSKFDFLLLLLIILEWYALFYTKGFLGQTTNAVFFFGISLCIGLVLLAKFYKTNIICATAGPAKKRQPLLLASLFLFLAFIPPLRELFAEIPIDVNISDIIPTVQVAVSRFLNGQYPYESIQMDKNVLPLTYLPMQWLPFTIPQILHSDYRWMAFGIWCAGCVVVILRTYRGAGASAPKLPVPILLLAGLTCLLIEDRYLIAVTIELMIVGYYMLFISSINQKNVLFQAIAFTLCLLSRYSLVLWLPLWAFVLFLSGNRGHLFKTIGIVLALVLVIYIIPFLSKDWSIFVKAYQYYNYAALGEWNHINPDNELPYHLYSGTGFAHLFYEQLPTWSVEDRLKRLQKIHLLLCLLVPLMMGIWYYFKRKAIHYRIFMMASFKIYLAFFLAFIQVPYIYLMLTAVFVSIAIYAEQLRYRAVTENEA